jgi:hypothetical protein
MRSSLPESLVAVFEKLILAGEQAGFNVDQMFDLLGTGMTIGMLLRLIELRLSPPPLPLSSSRWVM